MATKQLPNAPAPYRPGSTVNIPHPQTTYVPEPPPPMPAPLGPAHLPNHTPNGR
ncbi:MAG: hypothetical protein AB7O24_28595 [Kofleriaceae bacterium]